MQWYSYNRLTPSTECHQNSVCGKNQKWLPRQRPLRDQKTDVRLITCSHSSRKIGVVDVEIIGQTEIVKKITNKQIRNSSRTNAAAAGLAKYSQKKQNQLQHVFKSYSMLPACNLIYLAVG